MSLNENIYILVQCNILYMVQVQIDIDEHQDKLLRIYMAYNRQSSKAEAIKYIVDEYFLLRPPKLSYENIPRHTNVKEVKEDGS